MNINLQNFTYHFSLGIKVEFQFKTCIIFYTLFTYFYLSTEPDIPEPSLTEVELAIEKLKRH